MPHSRYGSLASWGVAACMLMPTATASSAQEQQANSHVSPLQCLGATIEMRITGWSCPRSDHNIGLAAVQISNDTAARMQQICGHETLRPNPNVLDIINKINDIEAAAAQHLMSCDIRQAINNYHQEDELLDELETGKPSDAPFARDDINTVADMLKNEKLGKFIKMANTLSDPETVAAFDEFVKQVQLDPAYTLVFTGTKYATSSVTDLADLAVRLKAFGTPGASGLSNGDIAALNMLDNKIPTQIALSITNAFVK